MHSHTGERPYLCVYCNKGFTSPYSLKVHTRQHTNEKPYVCEYCPMAFPQKVSLMTHLKSKHNVS
ncbi:zf-H2C2 2 domain containing protein [Asbolus verrucosus]|uniref:Zf-H2C2 2 domain containing protein n=1 Tax=Asbolus verrucosus TaxID=1661398 RepID=A0A482W5D3_ASBVE|nr:zf-H2C2 2 domain containing protein [Asbolus verrucosus]